MESRVQVCPLCEAGCGLEIDVEGDRAVGIRGDGADVTSHGYLCPKGAQLLSLEGDPDRLTQPMARGGDGHFHPISWEDAFALAVDRLKGIRRDHGRDAIAAFMGTVMAHKYASLLCRDALKSALKTRNWTGVSSQDTSARFACAHMLYGSTLSISVPDIDRTDFLLCIGANPLVSNGSMMSAPNVKARLQAILDRGGQLIVVDPRRSETAAIATRHVPIRPGTDAALLFAMIAHLHTTGRLDQEKIRGLTKGWDDLAALLTPFTPEAVSPFVAIPPGEIVALAEAFAAAPTAAAYSRMGPGNARHATLTCVAVELLNVVTGRLGAVGGAMFPTPAIDIALLARLTGGDGFDRYRSRVRGLPETIGELPATTLAEEIETPGEGQVRALITYAANPVRSVPNGRRLDAAFASLDFMVSIDLYINETTRHADLILPPAPLLAEDHCDFFFANMAARDAIRWTEPTLPKPPGAKLDWEILLTLAEGLGGGLTGIPPVDGLLRALGIPLTPASLAEAALRLGPYGDRFLPFHKGLNKERLRASPHGVDLGPLKPGIRRRVRHRGGRVHLTAPAIRSALGALAAEIAAAPDDGALRLIGRRELRSNNSWMHNLPKLVSGKPRCVLFVHPEDAARLGLRSGGAAVMESRIHRGPVPVHVTDEVMPGVVSLPHGYGHKGLGDWQRVASQVGGVSANDWVDDGEVDAISGQSILNGVPVRLSPLPAVGEDAGPAPLRQG